MFMYGGFRFLYYSSTITKPFFSFMLYGRFEHTKHLCFNNPDRIKYLLAKMIYVT